MPALHVGVRLPCFPRPVDHRDLRRSGGFPHRQPGDEGAPEVLAGEGNDRITFYLKQYYRTPRDFADLVYLSQAMQARAIGTAARHHRACRPVTLGSLYWQLNDSWPAISWSSIDWTGHDKMLQHEVRRFFAPQTIVAETKPDATRIALVSDATTPKPLGWRVTGYGMDGRKLGSQSGSVTMAAASASDVAMIPDATLFTGAAPESSYAVAELFDGDKVIARQIIERKMPRDMAYPAPASPPAGRANRSRSPPATGATGTGQLRDHRRRTVRRWLRPVARREHHAHDRQRRGRRHHGTDARHSHPRSKDAQ